MCGKTVEACRWIGNSVGCGNVGLGTSKLFLKQIVSSLHRIGIVDEDSSSVNSQRQ